MSHGVTKELLACMYCQIRLPTSITQEQYINHIRVKHGVLARAEVEGALVHLTQSKEKNPRLKRSAGTELPQPPPPCHKRKLRFQTVVDGGCSSTGAVRPRLLEVEDEMRAENVEGSETVVNNGQKVSESKEELIKDKATGKDHNHNQGREVAAARFFCAEAGAGEDAGCAHQMKKRVRSNLRVGSTVEAEQAVRVALEDTNCTKGRGIKKGHQKGKKGVSKLRNKKVNLETGAAQGGEGRGKAGFVVKAVECVVKECGKMFSSSRVMEDHMRRAHGAEKLSCPEPGCEVKFVSCWGLQCHIKNAHHKENKKTGASQQLRKKPKECPVEGCLKRFYTDTLKEDHMRMEHDQSKLVCQMCEASYFSQDGLNRHMKKMHKEEKEEKDATKGDLGGERDHVTANVGNVGDKSPTAVKVKETEAEEIHMEIF